MKEAMWGVGLVVLGLFGIVMINLFGNITVTNQFNYTTMKNSVQAAMLDSLDVAHYRLGFCLCTADGSKLKSDSIKTFNNKSEYVFRDLVNDKCLNSAGKEDASCAALYGQYRLLKDKFLTTFEERFSSMITNNKKYSFLVKEIVEYPPKVSVRVVSKDEEFSPTEKDSGGYNIANQIDAVIETDGDLIAKYMDPYACYKKGNTYEWGKESEHVGWELLENVDVTNCKAPETYACYKNGDTYEWGSASTHVGWELLANVDAANCKAPEIPPEEEPEQPEEDKLYVVVHHYIEGTTTKVHKDRTIYLEKNEEYKTKYYETDKLDSEYQYKYQWDGKTPKNSTGKMKNKNIEVIYYYVKPSGGGGGGNCSWHSGRTAVTCKGTTPVKKDTSACNSTCKLNQTACEACKSNQPCPKGSYASGGGCVKAVTKTVYTTGKVGFGSCGDAMKDCEEKVRSVCPDGYEVDSYTCQGYQTFSYKMNSGATGNATSTCSYTATQPANTTDWTCKG